MSEISQRRKELAQQYGPEITIKCCQEWKTHYGNGNWPRCGRCNEVPVFNYFQARVVQRSRLLAQVIPLFLLNLTQRLMLLILLTCLMSLVSGYIKNMVDQILFGLLLLALHLVLPQLVIIGILITVFILRKQKLP